ncbi:MAG: hypothetical protein QOH22_1776 [Gemmatimonadaceae bacterium]|jgi:hypothetical protein|nr:hypothetical protein [Gemmatimonadaceae bacterium]
MSIKFMKVGFLAALTVAAVGCGTKEAAGPLEPAAAGRVRFVNLITDPTRVPVNAILEAVPFGVNLGYTGTTPSTLPSPATANYSAILTGSRSLVLKKTADTSVTVATIAFTVAVNEDRTVYATGGTAGAAVTNFSTIDANPLPTSAQVAVRIVNMSPSAGALDYFITAANADLSAATPTAANVAYQGSSAYVMLAPGTYQVRAVPAGTLPAARAANVSVTINNLALAGGTGRTIVTADKAAGGTPIIGFVLADR